MWAHLRYVEHRGLNKKRILRLLREWRSPAELIEKLDVWIEQYNSGYLHSALGYKTPMQHEREHYTRHGTRLPAP